MARGELIGPPRMTPRKTIVVPVIRACRRPSSRRNCWGSSAPASISSSLPCASRPTGSAILFTTRSRAPVFYLPEYLHQEPMRVLRLFAGFRLPGFAKALRVFRHDLVRDFTVTASAKPGQALVLAAEWPQGGAWLHAHFIHTPASATRYASLLTGVGLTQLGARQATSGPRRNGSLPKSLPRHAGRSPARRPASTG